MVFMNFVTFIAEGFIFRVVAGTFSLSSNSNSLGRYSVVRFTTVSHLLLSDILENGNDFLFTWSG